MGQSQSASTRSQSPADFGLYPGYNDLPPTLDPADLHPVIRDFQALIEGDAQIYMGFRQIFEQLPNDEKYRTDIARIGPQIRNHEHMLYRLNQILRWAPAYGDGSGLFPIPMGTLFYWQACTTAGYRMLTNDKVNAHLTRILNTWAQFLSTSESRYTLTRDEGGWLSPPALEALGPKFAETFVCNPEAEYFGFKSWDDFFTRGFREAARPVDDPEDMSVITNPCESAPMRIAYNVKERDTFWIKEERYSLRHILNNDPIASQFVGGTVFHGSLSRVEYHRWHSPVSGTIVKIVSVPGTYFALSTAFGFEFANDPNPVREGYSQVYMTNVATRMVIYIQADNPEVGLMVFVAIGMVDVSSCEATVEEGEQVKKGDQLGMFHFGGSNFIMVFRPETKIQFGEEALRALSEYPKTRLLLNRCVGVVLST